MGEAIHSTKAWAELEAWRIGVVSAAGATARAEEEAAPTQDLKRARLADYR